MNWSAKPREMEERSMGNVSEMKAAGTICDDCGATLDGEAPGHPRKCAQCSGKPGPVVRRERCQLCQRMIRATGLQDHLRDAHG